MSKLPRLNTSITFSDSDLEGCQHPHDDPLVIRAVVANKTVHRVLVDNGSSADIIFASAFDKMGIGGGGGGGGGGGESSSARKAHLRNIRSAEIAEV